ncbi:molybdenum cofactor guanylyltransferase [Candidatus Omnitrophota bacterium]
MPNMHNDNGKIACAIFAGGENKRMGRHKAFLTYNGKRSIDIIRDGMKNWFADVYIVTNDKRLFSQEYKNVIEDTVKNKGPMGALLTAFTKIDAEYIFCIACDMPHINDRVIEKIINAPRHDNFDCIIPAAKSGPEPLCALYRKSMARLLESEMEAGQLSMNKMLSKCNKRYVDISEDTQGLININTPKEYESYAHKV